jgi:hypothetical protein
MCLLCTGHAYALKNSLDPCLQVVQPSLVPCLLPHPALAPERNDELFIQWLCMQKNKGDDLKKSSW